MATLKWVAAWLLVCATLPVWAQTPGKAQWEEYDKHIHKRTAITAIGPDLFGDNVDLASGALSFSATDVSVPGNNALPVQVGRSLKVTNRGAYFQNDLPFADWDLDLPRISGVFASTWHNTRCTGNGQPPTILMGGKYFGPNDYWHGNHADMPGGGELLAVNSATPKPTSGGPYRWVTAGRTYFSCLTSLQTGPGEGFLAITSDGTKYWFNRMAQYYEAHLDDKTAQGVPFQVARRKNVLYATRVEDRFGNWVTYSYSNAYNQAARLNSISSSDGRTLTLTYNGNGHVSQVNEGTRTWTYQYAYPAAYQGTLTSVTLPDASSWSIVFGALSSAGIDYSKNTDPGDLGRSCFDPGTVLNKTVRPVGTITHPSGAVGTFTVSIVRMGRSNVPAVCSPYTTPYNDPNDDVAYYPINWDAFALTNKQVSGPGLTTGTWSYGYGSTVSWFYPNGSTPICTSSAGCEAPQCTSDSCAGVAVTTVIAPDNKWMRHTFGNSYRYNEGKLLKVEQGSSATDILNTTTTAYNLTLTGQPYVNPIGTSPQRRGDSFTTEYLRPQVTQTIVQDGVTFNSSVTTGCSSSGVRCFDAFARSTSVAKWSSLGDSKTEVTAYHDNLSTWVVGQASKLTINGIVASETSYDSLARPVWAKAFGKLQHTLTYYTDGTLATVKDGNNNVTTLSSWYRGIPRSIKYPVTPEATAGATKSAVVNANGWITTTTDENGFATNYTHDAMGRLASIIYPTGDSTAWNTTTQVFAQIDNSEYGIPAEHWRQIVQTGNYQKFTYYDALWRPLLVLERDLGNDPELRRHSRWDYDAAGRKIFASYPSTSAYPTTGVRTTYDPLDRVKKINQDSELGVLTTEMDYLSGFRTQVKNPRLQTTTTSYMAYDQPTTDWPEAIIHPAGAYTDIVRDVFGKPKSVTRRDATRSIVSTRRYVYRGDAQTLCKVIEPESGATVMDFDAAGNLSWTSSGNTTLTSTGSCDFTAGASSGHQVVRSYDARNRIATLRFPDGRGNQDWTYTPDGLPQQITTYNGANSTQGVINAYNYNKRRMLNGQGESIYQVGWYTYSIGYGYDQNGNLASHSYPSGVSVTYAPNALGQATQAGTYATGVSYFPNGAIKQFTYGNNMLHVMSQNARQLPSTVCDTAGAGCGPNAALNDNYEYDQNGNVAAILDGRTDRRRDRTMTYDGLDRLTATTSPMFTGGTAYSYDVLDNLKTVKAPGRDHTYVYDADWRLTNVTNTFGGESVIGLEYDLQGNLKNKNGVLYGFDYGNRLRTVSNQATYRYDGHGRRVSIYDPAKGNLIYQYSASGQLMYQRDVRSGTNSRTDYISLNGSLVALREQDIGTGAVTVKYQHTDALGSPVAVTNASRTVIEKSEYEPYGLLLNRALKDGPGFTGHVSDAGTGLSYMQQRYYDPGIGRFLSVDPVSADGNTGSNFNRYWYANNNPYAFTDPDGREACGTDTTCRISSGMSSGTISGAIAGANGSTFNRNGSIITDRASGQPTFNVPASVANKIPNGMIRSAYNDLQAAGASDLEQGTVGYVDGDDYSSETMPAVSRGEIGWSFTRGDPRLSYLSHTHGNDRAWYQKYFSRDDTRASNEHNLPVFLSNRSAEFRVFVPGSRTGGKVPEGKLQYGQAPGLLLCPACMPTR